MGVSVFLVRHRKLAGLELGNCVLDGHNFFDGLGLGFFLLIGGEDFVHYTCGGSAWKGGRAGWGWGFVMWHVCRSQGPFLVIDWSTKVFLGYYGSLWEVFDYAN